MKPLILLVTLLLLILAALFSLRLGVVSLPWSALIDGWRAGSEHHYVLTQYRLPRLLLAIMVGAALAVSGVLVQGIVRNPLASPDILGVNHAAGLVTVVTLMLLPALPVIWLPLLAFVGGFAALILLRIIAGSSSPLRLALIGVALSATWVSLTDYLLLSQPQEVNNALLWLTGSLWGRDWTFVRVALPILLILIPLSVWFCRDLDLLSLGDERASTLGLNVPHVHRLALILAVALAATSVALCGPMGFISLVVPHLTRRLLGGRHVWLLPGAALIGAFVLTLADLLARIIHPPMELPAGMLTALIGAPWFIWLLVRMR